MAEAGPRAMTRLALAVAKTALKIARGCLPAYLRILVHNLMILLCPRGSRLLNRAGMTQAQDRLASRRFWSILSGNRTAENRGASPLQAIMGVGVVMGSARFISGRVAWPRCGDPGHFLRSVAFCGGGVK
jgi:hypothetical protein